MSRTGLKQFCLQYLLAMTSLHDVRPRPWPQGQNCLTLALLPKALTLTLLLEALLTSLAAFSVN